MNFSNTYLYSDSNRTGPEKCWPLQKAYGVDYVDYLTVKIIFGLLYSLVLIFGLGANALTLYCLKSKPLHFGLNSKLFISLTLADLFMSLTSLPITAVHIFTRRWLLGSFLCKFAPLFQGTCVFATSFTLMAIAVERYVNIAKSRSPQSTSTSTDQMPHAHSVCISALWALACFASMPNAWYMYMAPNCVDSMGRQVCICGQFCDECWPTDASKMIYGSFVVGAQFVAPLVVLCACYWQVRRTVGKSVRRRLTGGENLSIHSRRQLIRRKKRTSFITLILLLCFVVPWLPVNVLNLLRDYQMLPTKYESLSFAVAHLIAMTSILWNPMIYCLYNKEFFQTFKNAMVCNNKHEASSTVKSSGAMGCTQPNADTEEQHYSCCLDDEDDADYENMVLENGHGCKESVSLQLNGDIKTDADVD